jgi:2-polyprenyl-3-methyl-5-hydroxy-6-metoxy-1,4-benzoquinol methylase
MAVKRRFEKMYAAGYTPWDIGKPDFNLIEAVKTRPIKPCKALDIGCGTGDNSLWLCRQKFQVLGIDDSEMAIGKAKEKARSAGIRCTFMAADFLTSRIKGAPFGLAFDRGCLHAVSARKDRKGFAENVHAHLKKDGLWLSLIGNADEQRHLPGPPQWTAADIVAAVEHYFKILSLVAGSFGSNRPHPPRAWVCLMQKRGLA